MEAPQGQQEISSQQFSIPEIETDLEANPETEKPFPQFESAVLAVAISPQGRQRIAVGLADGTVEIQDVLTGTKWASCQGHTGSVNSVAFSPDGSMVVSGSEDRTVRLWDAKTGEAIGQPFSGHTNWVNSVAFNNNGTQVFSGINKMLPKDKFVFEKRTLNLAISFCFFGDVGYDPDDMYNREYRFEDGKKIYGFNFNQE